MKANPQKIAWNYLSANPNAIELFEENPDKINWYYFSQNPAIFTYDYDLIRERFKELKEDIVQKALHPRRMLRLMSEYGDEEIYNCYFTEE